ncbi:hypothetical protein E2562_010063 [Oryza meyeriana var. granulata]|uniref:Uncharacterized protein n=1 Tax=Oryza meyeriana var. granulata TaxID=110450 RepID=A0A6G1EHW5_9ORYZ|nr:hypothetical protein E2562_010063 [Oryza meyeriana var. granulata]
MFSRYCCCPIARWAKAEAAASSLLLMISRPTRAKTMQAYRHLACGIAGDDVARTRQTEAKVEADAPLQKWHHAKREQRAK